MPISTPSLTKSEKKMRNSFALIALSAFAVWGANAFADNVSQDEAFASSKRCAAIEQLQKLQQEYKQMLKEHQKILEQQKQIMEEHRHIMNEYKKLIKN